ncbi:putative Eukaryotic translation initiation factor 3 subunit G [Hypsibius exemplaris]|uniref:Eukaryotic translation initiation factor 3 subunit G n=1 Tax=Hypsibius exemplaris TaxID=2072580 RepID=A0A1W0X2N7_HYPEX|nr:putative Eukaryotic translation initiation factor 3 subunit G [Hypsibius exemplaris]
MEDTERVDWASELEEAIVGPRVEAGTKRIGDRKIVTEIDIDDDTGKKTKIVTEYKIITKRVTKAVGTRKNWRKFGDAAEDPPGPQTHTTKIADDVLMQFLTGREDVMGGDAPTVSVKEKTQVSCRLCGGEHWTTHCQYQGASDAEKEILRAKFAGITAVEPVTELPREGGGTGKYVPPSRRAGFEATMMQSDQLPSIRVSNLPSDVKEDDLRELFETFGRIKKVYLGKDKKTGDFKGFAFVTFYDQSSADKAIARVNGHRYFHMILSVDWANPSKS